MRLKDDESFIMELYVKRVLKESGVGSSNQISVAQNYERQP